MEASPGMDLLNKINYLKVGVAEKLIARYQGLARHAATPLRIGLARIECIIGDCRD